MRKISIVRRRLERRKDLETTALSRARQIQTIEPEEPQDFIDVTISPEQTSDHSHAFEIPHLPRLFDEVDELNGLMDLELTEDQTETIKRIFPIYRPGENNDGNAITGLEIFKNEDNKIVFRFNVKPAHPFQTLTSEDVCEMLKISRSTLYKTVRDHNIQGFKIGSQLRFLLEDVINYLKVCKVNASTLN